MIIQHICNETPIVSEDRNIPSHKCYFTVIENHLDLFLIIIFSLVFICLLIALVDLLLELFHCLRRVLEYILEMLTAVTGQMLSFCAEFLMAARQFLALLGNGLSLLSDIVLVSVWPKSLLPDEFMVQCCDLVDLLVHTVQVLLPPIDI